MDKLEQPEGMNRRNFLSAAITGIGALITAGLGIPAIMYIVAPASQGEATGNWIHLGAASKVEIGLPTLFKAKVTRQTGWITNETEISAYVLTQDGRDFVAMSNVCTHLGCRVRWVAERKQFFCPCHSGVFDDQGAVVSGPPPRPLDRFKLKVENGQLFIQEI
jgi:Rieske Fe-S protein